MKPQLMEQREHKLLDEFTPPNMAKLWSLEISKKFQGLNPGNLLDFSGDRILPYFMRRVIRTATYEHFVP